MKILAEHKTLNPEFCPVIKLFQYENLDTQTLIKFANPETYCEWFL